MALCDFRYLAIKAAGTGKVQGSVLKSLILASFNKNNLKPFFFLPDHKKRRISRKHSPDIVYKGICDNEDIIFVEMLLFLNALNKNILALRL